MPLFTFSFYPSLAQIAIKVNSEYACYNSHNEKLDLSPLNSTCVRGSSRGLFNVAITIWHQKFRHANFHLQFNSNFSRSTWKISMMACMFGQNSKGYKWSRWIVILFLSKSSVVGNYPVGYGKLIRDR